MRKAYDKNTFPWFGIYSGIATLPCMFTSRSGICGGSNDTLAIFAHYLLYAECMQLQSGTLRWRGMSIVSLHIHAPPHWFFLFIPTKINILSLVVIRSVTSVAVVIKRLLLFSLLRLLPDRKSTADMLFCDIVFPIFSRLLQISNKHWYILKKCYQVIKMLPNNLFRFWLPYYQCGKICDFYFKTFLL